MNRIKNIFYSIFRLFLIKKNTVLLFSYYGANYGGSPKYISEYIIDHDSSIKIVWAFVDPKHVKSIAEDIKVIKYNSFLYYYYLATSKVIITNYRMTNEFKKRNNQIYIQTWHSSLRLKMIEKDAEDNLTSHYVNMAKNDSKQIDMLLAGSQKSKDIYEQSFWYDGKYLECGTPQCDLFFEQNYALYEKIKNTLGINKDTKVLLYAPTFRKSGNIDIYRLKFDKIYKCLLKQGEGDWKILIRLHPHLLNRVNELNLNDSVIDVTKYDDIQELLYIADMVITDYSALMFDYALTKKPCFLYVEDLDNYTKNDRNLYFNINKLPFIICKNENELFNNIVNVDKTIYANKINKFLNEKIHSWDNGTACQQVYDYIKGEMNHEKV